jgi:hypothetical protein
MGGIGVEESAAVVPEQLNRLLTGDRPYLHNLLRAFERRCLDRPAQVCGTPSAAKANATIIESGKRM